MACACARMTCTSPEGKHDVFGPRWGLPEKCPKRESPERKTGKAPEKEMAKTRSKQIVEVHFTKGKTKVQPNGQRKAGGGENREESMAALTNRCSKPTNTTGNGPDRTNENSENDSHDEQGAARNKVAGGKLNNWEEEKRAYIRKEECR